jgi:D-arabinan exo alpha-(1,3)/(1,5)-arabinofuranosidase (non-reducing end)
MRDINSLDPAGDLFVPHAVERHPSSGLLTASGARSRRASSWDRTGGNRDRIVIQPGETAVLLDAQRPGCINHIYVVMGFNEITDFRDAILRCYWDGERSPSVEVPLGDFFALTHGRARTFSSRFTAIHPGDGCAHAMNAYFPMPFNSGALVTLENRGPETLGGAIPGVWYHIDWEEYVDPLPGSVLRFHAQWRQERPTVAVGHQPNVQIHEGVNLDGEENYVALEAAGEGHMVGLVLEIDNPHGGWFGEGDDMVFIDGDRWPPSIHGTGTEEVFGGAASPNLEYASFYTGYHLIENPDYSGLTGMYRWFPEDPIRFTESIRWTIEHGHANNWSLDCFSIAYWYQSEPHAAFPELPSRQAMLPPLRPPYEEARAALMPLAHRAVSLVRSGEDPAYFDRLAAIARRYYQGDFSGFLTALRDSGLD